MSWTLTTTIYPEEATTFDVNQTIETQFDYPMESSGFEEHITLSLNQSIQVTTDSAIFRRGRHLATRLHNVISIYNITCTYS